MLAGHSWSAFRAHLLEVDMRVSAFVLWSWVALAMGCRQEDLCDAPPSSAYGYDSCNVEADCVGVSRGDVWSNLSCPPPDSECHEDAVAISDEAAFRTALEEYILECNVCSTYTYEPLRCDATDVPGVVRCELGRCTL